MINFFCNARVSAAKVAPYQVFTSQNVEPLGGGWWSEPLGLIAKTNNKGVLDWNTGDCVII